MRPINSEHFVADNTPLQSFHHIFFYSEALSLIFIKWSQKVLMDGGENCKTWKLPGAQRSQNLGASLQEQTVCLLGSEVEKE